MILNINREESLAVVLLSIVSGRLKTISRREKFLVWGEGYWAYRFREHLKRACAPK